MTLQGQLRRPQTADQLRQAFADFYAGHEFVRVVDGAPRVKDVAGSNYCHIGVAASANGQSFVVLVAIDNLVKGAAGGAVQWMNRLLGLPESAGLTTLTLGTDVFAAYYKMETIEHFAHISLVARLLGGERLLSRQEVDRLQGLRGMYGSAAPAPICPPEDSALGDPASCQTVFAPETDGARLSPDRRGGVGPDREIRLTYRELTALIEAAVREIK